MSMRLQIRCSIEFPQAIPKRRVLAKGWAVKVERSRARGRVASNTLTALPGAIPSPPGIARLRVQLFSTLKGTQQDTRPKSG